MLYAKLGKAMPSILNRYILLAKRLRLNSRSGVNRLESDEELVEEARQGGAAALDALIRRHYRLVFAYMYRNVGDYHTAYDLTQEALLKAARAIPSLARSDRFRPWLLRIALNTCRDYVRTNGYKAMRRALEYREELGDGGGGSEGTGFTSPAPQTAGDAIEALAEREQVAELLNGLPSYQREALVLRFYHELKIKEIAELTGAGEPTVKARLKQGLAKLRRRLEGGRNE